MHTLRPDTVTHTHTLWLRPSAASFGCAHRVTVPSLRSFSSSSSSSAGGYAQHFLPRTPHGVTRRGPPRLRPAPLGNTLPWMLQAPRGDERVPESGVAAGVRQSTTGGSADGRERVAGAVGERRGGRAVRVLRCCAAAQRTAPRQDTITRRARLHRPGPPTHSPPDRRCQAAASPAQPGRGAGRSGGTRRAQSRARA